MDVTLTMTKAQVDEARQHLFPGDGNEAVVIALCGRQVGTERSRLLVHTLIPIPHSVCSVRTPDRVSWPTLFLEPYLDDAVRRGLAIVKIHSHPGGYAKFSVADDESDARLFRSLAGWFEEGTPHASVVMLPDGRLFGRAFVAGIHHGPLTRIAVLGDDLVFYEPSTESAESEPEFALRHIQAFGAGTFKLLSRLTIGVVGCSGTGSPVIEQLARLGVGKIVLVDKDILEEKNLNRVLNSTKQDVHAKAKKTDVAQRMILSLEMGTQVEAIPYYIHEREAVKAIAACDVVFGCMDSIDGRHILNRIATFYLIPYFDLGVRLKADGLGGVSQICGSVHYLQPGLSTLLSRELYTEIELRSAILKRTDPAQYEALKESKYIAGIQEDRPAVITVNMLFAAFGVNDFLARIHPYRHESNEGYALDTFSLANGEHFRKSESELKTYMPWKKLVGRGDCAPLLDMPQLSETLS